MMFALTGRDDDPEALEAIKQIMAQIREEGHGVVVDKRVAGRIGVAGQDLGRVEFDVLVVVGGDGTLLKATHTMIRSGKEVLMLGVKYGHIGFLCELNPKEFWSYLPRITRGDYLVERRRLLKVEWFGEIEYALNEVVLVPEELGRVVYLDVYDDRERIYGGKSDGIIVSSSLGSTAYIASRRGPIIDPELDVMVIDVMNPLLWGFRTIVMPFNRALRIRGAKNLYIIVDGDVAGVLPRGEELTVSGSNKTVSFIRFERRFYERVRKRAVTEI